MPIPMRRKAIALFPLLAGFALLLWIDPIRTPRSASAAQRPEESEPAMCEPSQLLPTGGPYVRPSEIWGAAFDEAVRRGVQSPRVETVLATTYGGVIRWTRSGWTTFLHPDREVYLVSVQGPAIVSGARGHLSFARTYFVYDAPTGSLVEWGATDLPEPDGNVGLRER